MIWRLWCRAVAAVLQNGYPGDAALKDCGWRGRLAARLVGLRL